MGAVEHCRTIGRKLLGGRGRECKHKWVCISILTPYFPSPPPPLSLLLATLPLPAEGWFVIHTLARRKMLLRAFTAESRTNKERNWISACFECDLTNLIRHELQVSQLETELKGKVSCQN